MKKYLSVTDIIVILITFILFTAAVFTRGITHYLFIEAGVLLVSIKIILMNYKSYLATSSILKEMEEIKKMIIEKENQVEKKS